MKTKEDLNKRTSQISDEEMELVNGGLDDLDKRELESEPKKNANADTSRCTKKAQMEAWDLIF